MPISSKTVKLSKIETLRLAKNYIGVLSTIVANDELLGSSQLAKSLSSGLSQGTSNLISGFLHLNPRTLLSNRAIPSSQASSNVSSPKSVHYDVFEPNGILRDYVTHDSPFHHHQVVIPSQTSLQGAQILPLKSSEDDTLMNSSSTSSLFEDESTNGSVISHSSFSHWTYPDHGQNMHQMTDDVLSPTITHNLPMQVAPNNSVEIFPGQNNSTKLPSSFTSHADFPVPQQNWVNQQEFSGYTLTPSVNPHWFN
jgi:hypothetical protein